MLSELRVLEVRETAFIGRFVLPKGRLQVETDFPADATAQNLKIHKRHRDGMRSNADVTATAELREPVAPKRLEEPEPAEPEQEAPQEPKESQQQQVTNSPTPRRRRGPDRH